MSCSVALANLGLPCWANSLIIGLAVFGAFEIVDRLARPLIARFFPPKSPPGPAEG